MGDNTCNFTHPDVKFSLRCSAEKLRNEDDFCIIRPGATGGLSTKDTVHLAVHPAGVQSAPVCTELPLLWYFSFS